MSTPNSKKLTTKTSFAAFVAKRSAARAAIAEGTNSRSTGKESWSEDNLSPHSEEFQRLVAKIAPFAGLIPTTVSRPLLTRLRDLRKLAREEKESLGCWQGQYVRVLPPVPSALSSAQIQSALSHYGDNVKVLAPNPYMSQEHSYQTMQVPPDDWILAHLQLNPSHKDIVAEDLLPYVFANPILANMLDRIDRAAVWHSSLTPFGQIESWWKEAVKDVKKQQGLLMMSQVPSWRNVDLDVKASPGYPFTVMPQKEGSTVPFTSVEQVYARDDGKFFEGIMQGAIAKILHPKTAEEFDARFFMYAVQSGNVKHVLRTETETKPNRAIFSAPLVLRHLQGAYSAPLYQNWTHPGSLLGTSFAHGKTVEVLAKILRVPPTLEAVCSKIKIVSADTKGILEQRGLHTNLRAIWIEDGFVCAPDKREFDMSTRKEFMETEAQNAKGVLPTGEGMQPEQQKKVKSWHKIADFCEKADGVKKKVVTNCRVCINIQDSNPSGSMRTSVRNTWICLCSERAADRLAWHNEYKNREFEEWSTECACGDDVVARLHGHPDSVLEKLWDRKKDAMRKIGYEYKPETTQLTKCLSDLEILGRHIYAYVDNDKVLGFVALRPQRKLWLGSVYPKEAVRSGSAMTPAALRAARMIMLADEAVFYPRHWTLAVEMFELNKKLFQTPPTWEKFYDPTFDVDYSTVKGPRAWAESAKLHLGVAVASAVAQSDDSDEADDNEYTSDLEDDSVPAAARQPKKQRERKGAKPKKQTEAEVLPEEDSDDGDVALD